MKELEEELFKEGIVMEKRILYTVQIEEGKEILFNYCFGV
jgi:hypothetical protein